MFANCGPFILTTPSGGGGSGPSADAVVRHPTVAQNINATTNQYPLTITTTGNPIIGQGFSIVPLLDVELTLSGTLVDSGTYATHLAYLSAGSSVVFPVDGDVLSTTEWFLDVSSNNALNGSVLYGVIGEAQYSGTFANNSDGSVLAAVFAFAENAGSGNPNILEGIYAQSANFGTGIVPLNYGIFIDTPGAGLGTGTITFNAGLYINDQSAAASGSSITATWGIYEKSASEQNALGSINLGGASGPLLCTGTGSPEGSVTAPPGSVYLNQSGGSGTTLYVKESGRGNTGWIGK